MKSAAFVFKLPEEAEERGLAHDTGMWIHEACSVG